MERMNTLVGVSSGGVLGGEPNSARSSMDMHSSHNRSSFFSSRASAINNHSPLPPHPLWFDLEEAMGVAVNAVVSAAVVVVQADAERRQISAVTKLKEFNKSSKAQSDRLSSSPPPPPPPPPAPLRGPSESSGGRGGGTPILQPLQPMELMVSRAKNVAGEHLRRFCDQAVSRASAAHRCGDDLSGISDADVSSPRDTGDVKTPPPSDTDGQHSPTSPATPRNKRNTTIITSPRLRRVSEQHLNANRTASASPRGSFHRQHTAEDLTMPSGAGKQPPHPPPLSLEESVMSVSPTAIAPTEHSYFTMRVLMDADLLPMPFSHRQSPDLSHHALPSTKSTPSKTSFSPGPHRSVSPPHFRSHLDAFKLPEACGAEVDHHELSVSSSSTDREDSAFCWLIHLNESSASRGLPDTYISATLYSTPHARPVLTAVFFPFARDPFTVKPSISPSLPAATSTAVASPFSRCSHPFPITPSAVLSPSSSSSHSPPRRPLHQASPPLTASTTTVPGLPSLLPVTNDLPTPTGTPSPIVNRSVPWWSGGDLFTAMEGRGAFINGCRIEKSIERGTLGVWSSDSIVQRSQDLSVTRPLKDAMLMFSCSWSSEIDNSAEVNSAATSVVATLLGECEAKRVELGVSPIVAMASLAGGSSDGAITLGSYTPREKRAHYYEILGSALIIKECGGAVRGLHSATAGPFTPESSPMLEVKSFEEGDGSSGRRRERARTRSPQSRGDLEDNGRLHRSPPQEKQWNGSRTRRPTANVVTRSSSLTDGTTSDPNLVGVIIAMNLPVMNALCDVCIENHVGK